MEDKFGKKYLVGLDNKPYFKAGDIFTLNKKRGSKFTVQFEGGLTIQVPEKTMMNTFLTELKST